MASQFYRTIDTIKDQAKDALWALTSCVCQPSAKIKINGRTFKIIKVLGEGGFSFVYLAQDETSGRQFALKKIRCPTGSDGVKEAMREVAAYRRFRHPNIIRILDSAVVQDRDSDGKVVYLFLPLYKVMSPPFQKEVILIEAPSINQLQRGNLQDAINHNLVNGIHFPEREMVRLFLGTCEAVRAMHTYRAPMAPASLNGDVQDAVAVAAAPPSISERSRLTTTTQDDEHDNDDQSLPQPEGDAEGGYSYDGASVPLVNRRRGQQQAAEEIFDGDAELERLRTEEAPQQNGKTEIVPYAHRDIKPGNVMLSDDGQPILMDFGSTVKARIKIETRQQALAQQDLAAEQSTMPYRAPELFDTKTGTILDEKVDIWSLGCTLYALAYSHSPFETTQTTEQGGSIAMSVLNGAYKHPTNAASIYSEGLRNLIDFMLTVNPSERPDIHQVIEKTQIVLQSLS